MRRVLLLLLSFSAAGSWAQSRPSQELHPSWKPDGTEIVFESDRAGNADIYVMHLASGETRRLTTSAAEDARPVWSPDGKWIAFHSNREGNFDLFIIRPDGMGLERITEAALDETNAAWNPASSQLVYEVKTDDHWILHRLTLVERASRELIDRPGDHLTPAWPMNDLIWFTYSPPGGNHDTDVIILSMDESGTIKGPVLGDAKGNSNIHYSEVRELMVFNSIRDGNWEIYTASLEGNHQRRLTEQSKPDLLGIDGQPAWSPDGSSIAITSGRAGSLDIVILGPDGTERRNLTASWESRSDSEAD